MAQANAVIAPTMSDEAVQAKTSKKWNEWFSILERAGASKLTHKEIVAYKSQVVVQHSKLASANTASLMKTYWSKTLDGLRNYSRNNRDPPALTCGYQYLTRTSGIRKAR